LLKEHAFPAFYAAVNAWFCLYVGSLMMCMLTAIAIANRIS